MSDVASQPTLSPELDEALYCPSCGYDLRALTHETCPECGEAIDRSKLRQSQLPWPHRHDRGPIRAFWRTVALVTFRPRRLIEESNRRVTYRDARWFHFAVVLWTVVASVGITAGCVLIAGVDAPGPVEDLIERWGFTVVFWGGWAIIMVLLSGFLFTATAVHTYWLHPKTVDLTHQNRGVALGYYAVAPLAFIPVFALLGLSTFVLGIWMDGRMPSFAIAALVLVTAAVVLIAAMVVDAYRLVLMLARRVAQRRGLGFWSMALGLPLCWLGLAVLWFALIPGMVAWLWLVVVSLTM